MTGNLITSTWSWFLAGIIFLKLKKILTLGQQVQVEKLSANNIFKLSFSLLYFRVGKNFYMNDLYQNLAIQNLLTFYNQYTTKLLGVYVLTHLHPMFSLYLILF